MISLDFVQNSQVAFHLHFSLNHTFLRDEDYVLGAVLTAKFLARSWYLRHIAWLIQELLGNALNISSAYILEENFQTMYLKY